MGGRRTALAFVLTPTAAALAASGLCSGLYAYDRVLSTEPQKSLFWLLDNLDIDRLAIDDRQLLHCRGNGHVDRLTSDLYPLDHSFTSSCDVGAGR